MLKSLVFWKCKSMTDTTDGRPATKTIALRMPIKFEDKEYTQLVLREPKAKEVFQADQEAFKLGTSHAAVRNHQIHLVSKVSDVPKIVVEQLPISTLVKAMAFINPFFEEIEEKDDDITKLIELQKSITFDGHEYAQIVLREPTVKEVMQADEMLKGGVNVGSNRNRQMHLVAKAAEVPFPVIEQLPISVLTRAMVYIDRFLDAGQETGES
jgi:hypothetical protein